MHARRIGSAAVMLLMLMAIAITRTERVHAERSADKPAAILEFGTMVGIPSTFTGTQAPIRGINGGGLPWRIASAEGELDVTGNLEVHVRGLVLAAGANAGINPLTTFRAVVSCLAGDRTTQNVPTLAFPATTTGDADIEAVVTLPQPCIAPIVFVTSNGGAWLAVTGH